jgi:hypothetical protein
MEDLSVEELASNLSTYKEQLREVSRPNPYPTYLCGEAVFFLLL